MSAVIEQSTDLDDIVAEIDEASGHLFKASLAVMEGKHHSALEELTSAIERASWASGLIKKEQKR